MEISSQRKFPPCKVKPLGTVDLPHRSRRKGNPPPGGPPSPAGSPHGGGPPPPEKDFPLNGGPQGGSRGKMKTKGSRRGPPPDHPGGPPGGTPLEEPPRVFPRHKTNRATAATREYPPQRASNQTGPKIFDPTGVPSFRREIAPLYPNAEVVPVRRVLTRRVPKTNNLAKSPRATFLLGATRVKLA